MAASAWAVGLTGVRAGMETAVSRKRGDHANGRGAGEPRPPRERGLRALCPPAPPGGERTPAGLRARLRASPVGASLGRAPSASAHRLGPFGAQHVLHLPSGCFSDDLQETMPEKQGAAHSAERQSLCSVRPESAKAAACGRARSPRVGAWLDPQTHRVWLWTARREHVTRQPTDTPRPTACLTHGGQGRVPRKGPRSPTRFWKQTILPNYTNSAHVQRHGLERWPGRDCHPPPEVRGF